MSKGDLRREIIDACPDETFETELTGWIDSLEQKIGEILQDMEIKDITEISKVEDAYRALDELHDELY